MTTLNNSLSEALADIIKPIVEEAIRQALHTNFREPHPEREPPHETYADKAFLNIKAAAHISGLAPSTIRLYIRKRRIPAQKVGRRVLIKRTDLEDFLKSNPL